MNDPEIPYTGKNIKGLTSELKEYGHLVQKALAQVKKDKVIQRIWNRDYKVWKDSANEISNRLGWLYLPESMPKHLSEIYDFVDEVRGAGFTNALLLGMGGSSLACRTRASLTM